MGDHIKKKGMCGAWALTEERRGAHWVSVGKAEERGHLEALGIEGRIILIWILKRLFGRA